MRPKFQWLALGAVAVAIFAIVGASPALAKPGGGGTTSSTCPNGTAGATPDTHLTASFTTSGPTTTYTFSGTESGVTLIGYCVYPPSTNTTQPGNVTAHFDSWVANTSKKAPYNFSFGRPTGGPGVPADGTSHVIGSADWGTTVPTPQTFLLHITAGVCGTGNTCFVLPAAPTPCSAGDANVAYNSMPSDVVNCLNPGIGFEATSTSEFGNAVNLSSSAGRNLDSFKMDMQSFACQTGHWNGNPADSSNPVEPCGKGDTVTPPGVSPGTFQWPVTANIYALNGDGSRGALLATSGPVPQTIPYRPAADTTLHCTGVDNTSNSGNRWWNPAALGGAGHCQSSIATVLSFSNFLAPSGGPVAALPGQVIWTVSFATTSDGTTGSPAQGPQACSTGPDPLRFPGLTDGGCPYDSLNPGDNGNNGGTDNPTSPITNAPYAGTDTYPNGAFLSSTWGGAYCDGGASGTGSLRLDTPCWAGLRPLGEIITH
jgi:hypothetical protein